MNRLLPATAVLGLLLAGCGGEDVQVPAPQHIEIPALDVASDLIGVGLDDKGRQQVPSLDEPGQAAYFRNAPEPGERGAAIIVGHINGNGVDGIFVNLDDLTDGDTIKVDGFEFTVYEVQRVSKRDFPRDRVYAQTDAPELRLITCGGEFDAVSGNYDDNVIAYAVQT